MCTAVLRLDPAADWPLLLAFVRDEDRRRPTSPPASHWSGHPSVVGGRDERRGGTWLAVDTSRRAPAASFVLNRFEDASMRPLIADAVSRGTLPLHALEHGGLAPDALELDRIEPFNLLHASTVHAEWWRWDGTELARTELGPGWHIVTSRGTDTPESAEREQRWLDHFRQATLTPSLDAAPAEAWGEWLRLLDGSDSEADDEHAIVIAGVSAYPHFGTSSGSLVALGADGDVRYDFSSDWSLAPASWQRVPLTAASPAPVSG